eukprot:CAMPEP_0170062950 /NCGR_PEP_ID=MMETSP0019_2-20121128/3990_1 /TAXON_ID=98059 /ORGANISM="Dinobryon sp., Strain UTEXLB2267" /LENGTH=777 /DNA_ID=CAMNT_0010269237 /DNA_START=71 /DNA_END=2404 /DNA_ORIENTATION=-
MNEPVPTGGRILVAVRVRPLSSKETNAGVQACCKVFDETIVAIKKCGDENVYLKSQQSTVSEYAFDVAFDEKCSQRVVYERTTQGLIPAIINGQNVTVFAYGSTGAGKTHTMLGNSRADAAAQNTDAGIIPNAVRDLLSLIGSKKRQVSPKLNEKWTLSVSFIEVYNEQVYDLLDSNGKVLSLREDQERGIVVAAGATEQVVNSYDEVMELLSIGNKNRKTEATQMNAVSSRSHAVLLLTVKHSKKTSTATNSKEVVVESKLSLIDLAGSERASATNNRGARLHEGANINKSLLALANCINALAANNSSQQASSKRLNVKYRDSKLTHLLKSSLEGNCNLVMIANINPADSVFEDSHNTLKYANRAKNLKVQSSAPVSKNIQLQMTAKETAEEEMEGICSEETAWLRCRVQQLERQLQSLQASLLSQGGVCRACGEELLPKPQLDLQFDDQLLVALPSHNSISRLSNCSALTSSSCLLNSDPPNAAGHASEPFSSGSVPISQSQDSYLAQVSTATDCETASMVGCSDGSKKRRCSFLPTAAVARGRKRRSVVAAVAAAAAAAAAIGVTPGSAKKSRTPMKLQHPSTPGRSAVRPFNGSASKGTEATGLPSASKLRRENNSSFFDEEPPRLILYSASKPGSDANRRGSRCVGKRKKSMARVSAMLDSLSQQNQDGTVSVSLRSAAGKAALFQNILSTKDDHTVFSSSTAVPSISSSSNRENASSSGTENANPNLVNPSPQPGRRVLTRSMANHNEDKEPSAAVEVQLSKRFGSKRQSV